MADDQTIIVKKVVKGGGGHHGGAWKVAYADFVTAMMAFFLLLWLLNVSTEEQLRTISNYFDPAHPRIAESRSGAGGVMGGLTMSEEGAQASNASQLVKPEPTGRSGLRGNANTAMGISTEVQQGNDKVKEGSPDDELAKKSPLEKDLEKLEDELRKRENEQFQKAKEDLEKLIAENPALQELMKSLKIDITPEGLRIQITDQDGKPLFPSGSADMFPYTKKLIAEVGKTIEPMHNDISIRGHTDSHQYSPGATYTNWELSADRANASRRALIDGGIPRVRIKNVMGKADSEPLIEENPLDAQNRRITIVLLREELEEALERGAFEEDEQEEIIENEDTKDDVNQQNLYLEDPRYPLLNKEKELDYKKTQGSVAFP